MSRLIAVPTVVCVLLTSHLAHAAQCDVMDPLAASNAVDQLMQNAQRASAAGRSAQAVRTLEEAMCVVRQADDPAQQIAVSGKLGRALALQGSLTSAYPYLRDGAELAVSNGLDKEAAALFNDLGVLERSRNQIGAASEAFERCYELSRKNSTLHSVASVNLARARLENEGLRAGLKQLDQAAADIDRLSDSDAKADALLSLAETYRMAAENSDDVVGMRTRALGYYEQALELAGGRNNQRQVTYALGYMSYLYADQGDTKTALELSRRASIIAQRGGHSDAEFLWQWQTGQLLAADRRLEDAVESYGIAAAALADVTAMHGAFSSQQFNEQVQPFYLEYADILLTTSSGQTGSGQQSSLKSVLALVDDVKVAETRDYFNDDCGVSVERQAKPEQITANVAIVTPITFADRIEVLISLDGQVYRHTAPVRKRTVRRSVKAFRTAIVERDSKEAYAKGREIYDWLIQPRIAEIRAAKVDTLVFAPDGPFRSVPPAALHDGGQYLIQEFGVATVLSLTQTDLSSASRTGMPTALVGGLTEAVQGFDALPAVATELEYVATALDTSTYQDVSFSKETLQQQIADGDMQIIHLATHAQFQSDYRESFLLTYDGKLPMDALDQAIRSRKNSGEPLELIVLSACETAVGDDLAALGLAGTTVKAGAKSAVASLWPVNDASTSALMQTMYSQLAVSGTGKANALRTAQLRLLGREEYSEPYYWAAFMLVGDWL